jgi:hypothetical protein
MPEKTLSKAVIGIRIFLCCLIYFGFIQSAVADHFAVTSGPAVDNMNIYGTITIDGQLLQPEIDEIAIVDTQAIICDVCKIYPDSSYFLTTRGNVVGGEGAETGENLSFIIWDDSEQREIPVTTSMTSIPIKFEPDTTHEVTITATTTGLPTIEKIAPNRTIGIGMINISGANFYTGTTVTIAGIPSEAVYYSSTKISVSVPMHEIGTVNVMLTNPNGQTAIVPNGLTYVELPCSCPVPDSGPTKCYDDQGTELPCPKPGEPFYGQAGNYTINEMSFTKMDNNGNDLPDDAEDWVMVRDNVTGLIWEIKQAKDGIADYENPNDTDNTYTWYDTNPANNLGYTGDYNDGKNTQAFIEQLNQKQLGGFHDWRMPSPKELASIANLAKFEPAIDVNFFPTTPSDWSAFYWSSTSHANSTGNAWGVGFNDGDDRNGAKDSPYYVRAVRGGQCWSFDNLVINGDRTITDIASGMMWELETKNTKQTWKNAMDYCENASTAMYTDWRLPEQKELRTIVNFTRYLPAININFFHDTMSAFYWSSTSNANITGLAWGVDFRIGHDSNYAKDSSYYVRAVRGGQSRSFGNLFIWSPKQASFWQPGNTMSIEWETQNIPGNVKISLSTEGGRSGTYETIAVTENDGAYDWQVTGDISVNCMLKIEPVDEPDKGTRQGLFTIHSYSNQKATFTIQSTFQDPGRENLFIVIHGVDPESRTFNWQSCVYTVKPDVTSYTPVVFNTSHASHANAMTFSPDGTDYTAVVDISSWDSGTYALSLSLDNGFEQKVSDILIDHSLSTGNPNLHGCPIPDFVSNECYDNIKEIDCPEINQSFYGQDGSYLINEALYIKMDANGNALPDDATSWAMVRDSVTGLIWEIKQMADGIQNYSNPNDADNDYTWYAPDDPQDSGVENNQINTHAFIQHLNQKQWGGFSNWRLPTIQELETLINHSETGPAIADVFTATKNDGYWSSTTANRPEMARVITFNDGMNIFNQKSNKRYVRAVVGNTCTPEWIDNNDGTITDQCTGLIWEKEASDETYTWETSLDICRNKTVADYSDWRLPSKQELRSIINYSSINPAAYPDIFYNQKSDTYWTGTSNSESHNQAWAVNFQYGDDSLDTKTAANYIRAVRGGQTWKQNNIVIQLPSMGSQWFVGDIMFIQWDPRSIEGNVAISLSRMGGKDNTFDLIATTDNEGQYTWVVSGQSTVNAVIRIEPEEFPELSSQMGMFSIDSPRQIYRLAPSEDNTDHDDNNELNLALNESVELNLSYQTNDDCQTFGTGIRFHYNGAILELQDVSDILNDHFIENTQPASDTENQDGDNTTDTFIYLKWQSIYPDWPNASIPLNLATLTFKAIESGRSPVNMTIDFPDTHYIQDINNIVLLSNNQPPVIHIDSINQRTDGSGLLDIVFTGTDAENDTVHWVFEQCSHALDGSNDFSPFAFYENPYSMTFSAAGSMYTAVIDASGWTDGNYQIQLAVDNDHVPVKSSLVSVDNTPPEITVSCGDGGIHICIKESNSFYINGTCSNDTQSITIYQTDSVYQDVQTFSFAPTSDNWDYPISLNTIDEHEYTMVTYSYTIVASDSSGNTSTNNDLEINRIPKNDIQISMMDHLVLLENTEQQSITFTVSSSFGGLLKLSSGFESNSMISHTLLSNETLTTQPSETITLTLTIFPIKGRFGAEKITLSAIDEYDRSQSSSLIVDITEGNWWYREYNFQWVDICAISKNIIFAIDRNGAIYQFNGQFWKPLRVAYSPLTAIWGNSENNVYAVGANGYVIHYNGMEWTPVNNSISENFVDIWGTGTGILYGVSDAGSIFKYEDSQWESVYQTSSVPLTALWGSSSTNIYAVGNNGTIVHFDTMWTILPQLVDTHLTHIWGSQKNNIYAVGENGTIIHYDGTDWAAESSPITDTLNAIWGLDETAVFASGDSGVMLKKSGTDWQEMPRQAAQLNAIAGTDANHVLSVGNNGLIVSHDGSQWTQTASYLTAWSQMTDMTKMTAIWGISDICIFAAGRGQGDSVIFQFNGSQWNRSTISDSRISGLWGSDDTKVFAVGEKGQIFYFDGQNWMEQESGIVTHLNAVWGTSSTDVFAVGDAGLILHFDGYSWEQMETEYSQRLNAIWGRSSQEIYAVGDSVILHYDGENWTLEKFMTAELFTIQGNATHIFAGGEQTILSYQNQAWEAFYTTQTETIMDISPPFGDEWFAIGDQTIWQCSTGNEQCVSVYSSDTLNLRAIWGSLSHNRYAIADNGIILHYKENKAPESANQKHFLQALHTQTLGNQWTVDPVWQISESECKWSGITCNASQNIVAIDLSQKNLDGTLPQTIDLIPDTQHLFLQGNTLHGSVPAHIQSLTQLIDNQSDFRYNALYTNDPDIRAFLNQKQMDGNWENTQTIAPSNIDVQADYTSLSITWSPIAYTQDAGYYEIFFRPARSESLDYSRVQTADKTVTSLRLSDLSSDTAYDIRMRTVTLHHDNNPNDLYSRFSEPMAISTLNTPTSITIDSIEQRKDASGYLDIQFTGMDLETNTAGFVLDECVRLTPYTQLTLIEMAYTQMTFDAHGNTYTTVVDASDWESGTYQIQLAIENAISAESQAFTVDNTPPAIPVISTGNGLSYSTVFNPQVLTGTCDLETRLIIITRNGVSEEAQMNADGSWSHNLIFEVGLNEITVQAFDQWGNHSEISHIEITYHTPLISPEERNALVELYRQTNGDQWMNRDNWNPTHQSPDGTECLWYGITCNETKERFIGISLPENNLAGAIPREISQLTNLQSLNISGNRLIGDVPETLTNLLALKENQSDFRYNGLTSQSSDLIAFMNAKQIGGAWRNTQTVTPENFRIVDMSSFHIALSWDPIDYTVNGEYAINKSLYPDGPFETIHTVSKTESSYTVTDLDHDTDYYFTIQTNSIEGWRSPQSDTVHAKTEYFNFAPDVPSLPSPENFSENVSLRPMLSWTCGDQNQSDVLAYNLYFSTSETLTSCVACGLTRTQFQISSDLEYDQQYYWRIDAIDTPGEITQGPVWQFRVVANNAPELFIQAIQQFTDGSGRVKIFFTGTDAENDSVDWQTNQCQFYETANPSNYTLLTFETDHAAHTAHEPMTFLSSGTQYTAIVDASHWKSGQYQLKLAVTNSETIESDIYTIDHLPPSAPVITTNGGNNYTAPEKQLVITGTCDSDTQKVMIGNVECQKNLQTWSYNTVLDAGENHYAFYAVDHFGNVSDLSSITITLNTPPTIQITDYRQFTDGSGRVEIFFTGTDAENDEVNWLSDECNYWSQSQSIPMPLTILNKDAMLFSSDGAQLTTVIDASSWDSGDYTITLAVTGSNIASYAFSLDNDPKEFRIIVSSHPTNGGTIQVNGADVALIYTTTVSLDDPVTLTASPQNNYIFVKWNTESNSYTSANLIAPHDITSHADIIYITAVFNRPPVKPVLTETNFVASASVTSVTPNISIFEDEDADARKNTYIKLWLEDQFQADLTKANPQIQILTGSSFDLTQTGLKYHYQVGYQDTGSEKTTWSDDDSFITGIANNEPSLTILPGTEITEYEMVSFTKWPSNPSATGIFDYLGVYEDDFRMGTYEPEKGNYIEYPYGLNIEPGRAYWVLIRDGNDLSFDGVPVSTQLDFDVPLKYAPDDGWNMIACPNDATYQWTNLQVLLYNDSGDLDQLYKVAELDTLSETELPVEKHIWKWNHKATGTDRYIAYSSLELEPNQGYWVKALKPNVYLRFPKDNRTRSIRKTDNKRQINYDVDEPPMPMSDSVFEVYESAPGGCFIEKIFDGFGVLDLLFFLGLLVIIITCHISIRKKDRCNDERT